jgi:Na+-driven multidrug efflux pump
MMKKDTSMMMTEGPIWRRIIAFAIPVFIGNVFQQLYNTVDSLIVGNFIGKDALAAVSSSGSLIFLMVGFFSGISMGAGVSIARYFGARHYEEMQESISALNDVQECFILAAEKDLDTFGTFLDCDIRAH